jgi:hypothetical protein
MVDHYSVSRRTHCVVGRGPEFPCFALDSTVHTSDRSAVGAVTVGPVRDVTSRGSVDRTDRLSVDTGYRGWFPSCTGRLESAHGRPDRHAGHCRDSLFLERNPGTSGIVLFCSAGCFVRCYRRVSGNGSGAVLLFLGSDAGAHVPPHRHMGKRQEGVRSRQVLFVHPRPAAY